MIEIIIMATVHGTVKKKPRTNTGINAKTGRREDAEDKRVDFSASLRLRDSAFSFPTP